MEVIATCQTCFKQTRLHINIETDGTPVPQEELDKLRRSLATQPCKDHMVVGVAASIEETMAAGGLKVEPQWRD